MRKLYIKRERALACFAIPYHCVVGQSREEHLRWVAEQDRAELMMLHGPGTMKNGETICMEMDENPSSLFVIAYQEHGELTTQEIAIPAGSSNLAYTVKTQYDGSRRLALELSESPADNG